MKIRFIDKTSGLSELDIADGYVLVRYKKELAEARLNERQKVLAEVKKWIYEPKPVYVQKNNEKFSEKKMKLNYVSVAELRAKLREMGGE